MLRRRPWDWDGLIRSEDNKAWKEWVDAIHPEPRDLQTLLNTPSIRPGFKARALSVALAPTTKDIPVYWHERRVAGLHPVSSALNIRGVDHAVVATLIKAVNNMSKGKATLDDDTAGIHQGYVLQALKYLPVDHAAAQAAFGMFCLREISCFYNMDDASGYRPFRHLLFDTDIPHKWKISADVKMRQIIDDEIAGKLRPRAEHEAALPCYANIVMADSFLWDKVEPPYPTDLLASQIDFICQRHAGVDRIMLVDKSIISLITCLKDPNYLQTCRAFVNFVLEKNFFSPGDSIEYLYAVLHACGEQERANHVLAARDARDQARAREEQDRSLTRSRRDTAWAALRA